MAAGSALDPVPAAGREELVPPYARGCVFPRQMVSSTLGPSATSRARSRPSTGARRAASPSRPRTPSTGCMVRGCWGKAGPDPRHTRSGASNRQPRQAPGARGGVSQAWQGRGGLRLLVPVRLCLSPWAALLSPLLGEAGLACVTAWLGAPQGKLGFIPSRRCHAPPQRRLCLSRSDQLPRLRDALGSRGAGTEGSVFGMQTQPS